MKLHRLELAGFGPFRDRQAVDFDAFDADGIFLISGRTGAGKSSILDGVCFALYGSVPRYGGSGLRVRSDHCAPGDPTEVVLEFSTGGTRYRLTRSPDVERPKKNGGGTTTVPHAALLEEGVAGGWVARAAKPRDVALVLDDVLGLTREQFLQVILLAQNRFSEFLLARNDDRQSLLRTLFGTRVYADYQAAVEDRRRRGDVVLARGDEGVRVLIDEAERVVRDHGWGADAEASEVAERIAAVAAALPRATYRRETAVAARDAAIVGVQVAEATLAEHSAVRVRQLDRLALRERLAGLEERAPEIAAARAVVADAAAAEALRSSLDAVDRSTVVRDAAVAAVGTAREAWGADDLDVDALRVLADDLAESIGTWRDAADLEGGLSAREAAIADRRSVLDAAADTIAAIDAQLADVPAAIADLDGRILVATADGAGLVAAVDAEATARAALSAAREAERLEPELRAAEERRAAAAETMSTSAAEFTALLRRRLAGHAGELAAALVEGEPCVVCGSLSHPTPAAAEDPVTDDDVVAAERAKDAAIDAERETAGDERRAREAHADAIARAGGVAAAELAPRVTELAAAVAAARAAREERDRLAVVREETTTAATAASVDRDARAASLANGREADALATRALDDDRAEIVAARGEHPSVAARIADAEGRRTRARVLAEALADERIRAAELADRLADRDRRISASAFSDVAAVRAAIREPADVAAVDVDLRDHDAALRSTRDRLRDLELDLAGTTDEPVDLSAAERAVEEARTAAAEATEVVTRIILGAERLVELDGRIRTAHAEVESAAAEHAVAERLAAALSGRTPSRMDLETFVLAAELEEIVVAANLRLDEMSSGRYRLRHTDALAARGAASGLGLEIVDAHTGRARPPQSLSGGESFLASLALALGLAEVVTSRAGGIRLDTLFIDEGFGSLDADTLDIAMRTLDSLRQGGRTVGVISHVEAMKEQISARLEVSASPQGPSVIRQQGVHPVPRDILGE